MSWLEDIVNGVYRLVWSSPDALPWMVVALLGTGIFVTVRLGFVQLRFVGHAIRVTAGKYDDPEHDGDISHFQALSTALSATVGIGNIAGVATAIHYGGPGALFWMWVTAIFGMALKFAECTLSMKYRAFDERGNVAGGPMYYIERGLGPRWKPMAVLFAFMAISSSFGSGNMNQANTVKVSAVTDLGAPPWLVGVILATLVAVVILGGIKRIGRVSSKLAPMMALFYVVGALAILFLEYDKVPGAFLTIIEGAFSPKASLGGSVAGVFTLTLLWGVKRGLFSNEAGQGSAPIAHAAARTDEPVREGAVALLEPLIDTLVICTMTGLVIVSTGVWQEKRDVTIPIGTAEMVAADLIPTDTVNEHARVHDAIDATTALEGTDAPARTITVAAGRPEGLAFVAYDGFVEEPVLLGQDGRPIEGLLRYEPAHARLVGADGKAVVQKISGKMLQNSSALTSWAFQRGLAPLLGEHGNWVVTISVFLFALSTIISWSYYGDRSTEYLFGVRYVPIYRMVYVFFVFLGSILSLEIVWTYGDLALGLMALPNLIAINLLTPKVASTVKDYFRRMRALEHSKKA